LNSEQKVQVSDTTILNKEQIPGQKKSLASFKSTQNIFSQNKNPSGKTKGTF
jgi:hypothetical protein